MLVPSNRGTASFAWRLVLPYFAEISNPSELEPVLCCCAPYRAEAVQAGKTLRDTQAKLREAEAALAPLQRQILALEADKESAAQELAAAKEQQACMLCCAGQSIWALGAEARAPAVLALRCAGGWCTRLS